MLALSSVPAGTCDGIEGSGARKC